MYKISITDRNHNTIELTAKQGQSLFSAFSLHQPPVFQGNCGGRGQCQACRVFVEEFGGYKKACETMVDQDLHVTLPFVMGEHRLPIRLSQTADKAHAWGIAVDIGTTTIGMRLFDLDTGEAVCEHTMYNPQAVYGADVISRIAYAKDAMHAENLKLLIWEQLMMGANAMLACADIAPKQLKGISVAANTTMIYLLMGFDTKELGSYPFLAGHLEAVHGTMKELLPDITSHFSKYQPDSIALDIYPGFSAFVGADIMSGAVSLKLGQTEKYDLLIDLGTNGEILLINANQGFCGAASCGSAFDGYVTSKTHSTDILSRMMLLRTRGIIHKDGSFMERYVKTGYTFVDGVAITQDDIRNVQKAKAAIRTGIDMLLAEADISFSDCNVYVAGNFGFHLELSAARGVGMFPPYDDNNMQGGIRIAGNSSLAGAQYLLLHHKQAQRDAALLSTRCKVLEFANHSSFSKKYIDALDFE